MAERTRLVATDLDGTLLRSDGTVSPRTVAAIREARASGVEVLAVTARSPWSASPVADRCGMGPLAVCGNGAVVWDVAEARLVEHTPLAAQEAAELVLAARDRFPGILFGAETVDEVVAETGLFDPAELVVWAREASTAPDVLDHLERPVTKLICHHPGRPVDPALLAELATVCGNRATVTSAGTGWAEIGAPQVTKALALALVCERLGIPAAEVACVGDSLNDLPMLAWAGLPVAVANARPELLAAARRVVPANDEDGVASLLEELCAAGGGAATSIPASERG